MPSKSKKEVTSQPADDDSLPDDNGRAAPPLIALTQTQLDDIRQTQQEAFTEINAKLASLRKKQKTEKKPKKKRKNQKNSSSDEDSSSFSSSDSDSDSDSKTKYPFKNLESQLMTLLGVGNRWADTNSKKSTT